MIAELEPPSTAAVDDASYATTPCLACWRS